MPKFAARTLVRAGTGIAAAGCLTALYNWATLRRLPSADTTVIEPITVCVPARDEAHRLPGLIGDLRAQVGVPRLRILILDDASTDGTEAAALAAVADDPRCTVLRTDTELPPGWTGKAAACARLAEAADSPVLIFVDADVRLAPTAIAAAVTELRRRGLALLSPWPRQEFGGAAEALVQPLLCWSWASTLPIRHTDRGLRPSTAVACGQFLVFDTERYRAIGGHRAVAASPTEDLDLARILRRSGQHTAVAVSPVAHTRMYSGAAELEAGYTRWLWSAYGASITGGALVAAVSAVAYWLPPLAMLFGRETTRRTGLLGYTCAVTGRLITRGMENSGPLTRADILAALAHPLSVAGYLLLWSRSHAAHRRGATRWKGRATAFATAPNHRRTQ